MSAPLRFLSVAVLGWAGLRATTLGALPGFTVSHAAPLPLPPVVPTQLNAPLPSTEPQAYGAWADAPATAIAAPMPPVPARFAIPHYGFQPLPAAYSAALPAPRPAWSLAEVGTVVPASADYAALPPLQLTGGAAQQSVPSAAPAIPKLDRWQLSSWAVLRGPPGPGALASGGTLGGSQGGARVTYAFNRAVAASLRMTSPLGGSSGAELAAGVRWQPLRSLPLAITAERRQSLGRGGGRSDFAILMEAGLYRRPLPWRFELDAYLQAGVVGLRQRDMFADGAMAFTRPVHGRFSAGFGLWGGYQPGLYRLDAGPRVSMRVRDNIGVHVDWRQRIVGNSVPASGPALTLAADF